MDALLVLHVAAGTLGLLLGPVALWSETPRRSFRSRTGLAYHWSVLAVSVTAVALAALSWSELWWLTLLATLAYGLALLGLVAPRRRFRGWVRAYAHGQGGSYIALVTALLVVSVGGPLGAAAWAVPTLAGLPLIERRVARIQTSTRASAQEVRK